ncbi:MAG TPA: ATP-binding protein [Nitrososphaerales archaeon]|nr:ATP-binding protein [Nitrososphaerales archaeon]
MAARRQIFDLALSALSRNHILSADVSTAELAEITEGYSGAEIKAICDCARDYALFDALRNGVQRNVTREDLESAIRKTPRSIALWINDAVRASKRYGEENYYPELEDIQKLLHLETTQ